MMDIREAADADLQAIRHIHTQAFGEETEADLVRAILADPTAAPLLSLIAEADGRPLGHVLFSRVGFSGAAAGTPAAILAPLAVLPEAQRRGIGGALIEAGLTRLRESGTGLVFVLGDPAYYRRFGFAAAGAQGLAAPHPIPAEHAEAWMVQALRPGLLGTARGAVACCAALSRPELWRE